MPTQIISHEEERIWIPDAPKDRLERLAERIKPVIMFPKKGRRHYIKPVDIFNVAYTWSPVPAGRATGLVPFCDIRTYHRYGYYGFFKPSIAEVLAQIPFDYLEKADAFEIVEWPQTSHDLNNEREALNAGYHVAKTRLFARKK